MPARLRDLKRALAELGLVLHEPGSGSHWKFVAVDGKTYSVPAGNGLKTEIDDVYLKGLCRTFGLDYKKLKQLL